MRFLVSWLGEFVDLADLEAPQTLADQLTAAGLAVESIAELVPGVGARGFAFEVEVTSNRPDAMCHFGLARELAVILGRPLRRSEVPAFASAVTDGASGAVTLVDPEGCPRYVARAIRGVRVGPSPEWLVERLEAIGSRSINNVVDATNYVLWELGQPLHAFDLATIPAGEDRDQREIRVRRAFQGERLTTLDGKERALDPEILVIADRAKAIGLAGIMGGLVTEVTAKTTDVLLESAHFDRRRVRIGAKRLQLHTDASHRFERGVDFELCDEASRRCAALIQELAGGRVDALATDAIARQPPRVAWTLEAAALERFAGIEIGDTEIEAILGGLGFAPERQSPAAERRWQGVVPGWRAGDFEPRRSGASAGEAYPQDLFEEILRHVGYARIPATLPLLGGVDAGSNRAHERAGHARDLLAALGYAETIHYAFQPREWDARFPVVEGPGEIGVEPLALANPLSERYAVLRRSLVPNLVAGAESNANYGAAGVRLFEVGHLFPGGQAQETSNEREAIAWVAGGESGGKWDARPEIDLFAAKGVGEALFDALGARPFAVESAELPGLVAGTGAHWRGEDGTAVGWFGRVASTELPFALFAGEVLLDRLPKVRAKQAVVSPPRLPGVSADLTLTHPLSLTWAELAFAIESADVDLLVGFRLKERYQGAGVPAGAVATTITFDYHGGDRSLTQEEVNTRHAALQAELEQRFGVDRKQAEAEPRAEAREEKR